MIRETDLVSYLPPFLAEYREINEALSAEDPEFGLVWKAADKALKNEFIATADEYGISRFEKMLGIFPMPGESTETRRQRVQLKWLAMLPYTLPRLRETLEAVLGPGGFLLDSPGAETYCMRLVLLNQADEIYFSVTHTLISLMQKLSLNGHILSSDERVGLALQVEIAGNLLLKGLAAKE